MSVYGSSTKDYYWLFDFWYGDPLNPTHYRVSDYSILISNGTAGGVFNPLPGIEATGLGNQGTLKDAPVAIVLQRSTFTDLFTAMAPSSPMFVRIWEVVSKPEVGTPQQKVLYFGRLTQGVKNVDGIAGKVRLEFQSLKGRLNVPFGVTCLPTCRHSFGDLDCKVDAVALEDTGTLEAIDGKRVTITGVGAQTGKYWHRGFVTFEGLSIMVRDWDAATPTYFFLTQEPPASWLTSTVTIRPGCDKTIETCRARWANEANFGGAGYKLPSRNPAFHA